MKTKWCPHVRISMVKDGRFFSAFNKWFGTIKTSDINPAEVATNCIASDCAMWEPEYDEESKKINTGDKTPEGWTDTPHDAFESERQIKRWIPNNKGDCGLKSKENGCFYP